MIFYIDVALDLPMKLQCFSKQYMEFFGEHVYRSLFCETSAFNNKLLNFALLIFDIFYPFCEILYPPKISKPQNREIRYLPSLRFYFS